MKIQKNQLREIIRPLVKEEMMKIFAELHLEKIIGESIGKAFQQAPTVKESIVRPAAKQSPQKSVASEQKLLEIRRKMLDEMHVSQPRKQITESVRPVPQDNDVLGNLLADTEASGFSISEDEGNVNPELVPEDVLSDLIGEKDFSKFL